MSEPAAAAAPRVFTARKESDCAGCSQTIHVGEPITWGRSAADRGKIWHAGCLGTTAPANPAPVAEVAAVKPALHVVESPKPPPVEPETATPALASVALAPIPPAPASAPLVATVDATAAALGPLADLLAPMIAERLGIDAGAIRAAAVTEVQRWLRQRLAAN